MDMNEAVTRINGLRLQPGWSVTAKPNEGDIFGIGIYVPMHDTLRVEFTGETVNTNLEFAREGYPQEFTAHPGTEISGVAAMSWEQIRAQVMAFYILLWVHELREFFRDTAEDFHAPYHPHHYDSTAFIDDVVPLVDVSQT